jgi:GLPGLI family protein
MNRLAFSCIGLLAFSAVQAQQKEGKVIYQRTIQRQLTLDRGNGPETSVQTLVNKFEVNFANNKMILKQQEDDISEEPAAPAGPGIMIRTIGSGMDDETYCDFEIARKVDQLEFFDKTFIIADSIRAGSWKLSNETKNILGHVCHQATTQNISKRMSMSMENGKMERKEVDDTSAVTAWFTTDIPVPAAPDMQGQLPGAVLEMETNNGQTVYVAIEISPKADLPSIKEPAKGKKITPAEFVAERNRMMEEMQRNNKGGNMQFRMN